MTVPNLITTIRIILAPIFMIYLIDGKYLPALIVFVICGASDGLDGLVARLFNQKSKLGTFLDPAADKIILVSAFVALSVNGSLPTWMTITVISRDVIIVLGVFVLFLNRLEIIIKPSVVSKITTCFQFFTVIAVLSKPFLSINPLFYQLLYYVTTLLTISSGLHYIHLWFRMIGEGVTEK